VQKTAGPTSLSESSLLRYFTFVVLYFSQGIPEGITIFAIPAWLAMNGKSPLEIAGYSAVIMIPFSMKVLMAPVMERYTYLPMGRRRPWLLFGQFGILCSTIALSFVPNPLENIFLLSIAALCVHIFIVFQDVATDSLVIDVVPIEQQGKANSLMWGAKTIGTSLSLIVGSWLINEYGMSRAAILISVSIFLIMLVPLTLRERQGEKLLPWTSGKTSPEAALLVVDSWKKLFKSFKQVVLLPNTLLLLSAIFFATSALHYMRTSLPVFTIQTLGWDNLAYSNVYSMSNLAGGIMGMLIGGLIIKRLGILRMIQWSLFLMATIGVAMTLFSSFWSNGFVVSAFIVCFCMLVTLITIGALALSMHLCWKRISALQFTFCMTVFNLGMSAGAALVGVLRSHFNWQIIFLVFGLLNIVALFIVKYIKTKNHLSQVDQLEKNYLAAIKTEATPMISPEAI
jgi:PAT family beta-lactamase induction signal transducer AmpG